MAVVRYGREYRVNEEPPHVLFRNMVFALLGLFLFGMAALYYYMMMQHGVAVLFWWCLITGGVPAGVWIIWQNMRAKMTGERLSIDVVLMPFVGVTLAAVAVILVSAFAF